jgi:hypothetical protein
MFSIGITALSPQERNYHLVNIAFILLIVAIFAYSLVFKGENHPVPALFTKVTGEIPPSKGLSESFSEIVRGNLVDAARINPHGLRIFAFFALQLLLRIFFSLSTRIRPDRIFTIAIADSAISIVVFIWCFAPLIEYTIKLFGTIVG